MSQSPSNPLFTATCPHCNCILFVQSCYELSLFGGYLQHTFGICSQCGSVYDTEDEVLDHPFLPKEDE